jgi:uncharacterized integral membrane protein (TIGR00697 family)
MAAFVMSLICTDLIAAGKVIRVAGIETDASVLFFPITFFFNDILTEVYGYARSRKVIWMGFISLIFATLVSEIVVALPPAPTWPYQEYYRVIFGHTYRIAIASFTAFFCGEFVNSFTLAKMKILTKGRQLWSRTIGSTVAGQAVDTLIFYPVAFYGFWPDDLLWIVIFTSYLGKVMWEVIATPLVYKAVGFLKKNEQEDYYDYDTDFTPFKI